MNVVAVYRSTLKKLFIASYRRPHFVFELRFILSRPWVCIPAIDGAEKQSSVLGNPLSPLEKMIVNADKSQFLSLDSGILYESCKDDLKASFSPQGGSSTDIKKQIEALRSLKWINRRLDDILNKETEECLSEEIAVSKGPTEDDFIDDEQLKKKDTKATKREPHNPFAIESGDTPAVFSAGASGIRGEMWVRLRTEENFLLFHEFVRDYKPVMDVLQQQKVDGMTEFEGIIHEKVPRECSNRNEDVQVTLTLSPFEEAQPMSHLELSPFFPGWHNFFKVTFEVTALEKSNKVQILNTFFCRFDTMKYEELEMTGLIAPSDFMFSMRQIDPDAYPNNEVPHSDLKQRVLVGSSKRRFQLVFMKRSEGIQVLKGLIYYRVADDSEKLKVAPVKVVPFSMLRLES